MTDLQDMALWAPTLLLVTVRVAGMAMVAPVFGSPAVPVKLRLVVSAAMALGAVGLLGRPVALPTSGFDLAMGLVCEAIIGAAIGYAARLIVAGVELGAFQVSSQMGLSLAELIGGGADSPSSIGGLFRLLAVVVFLAVGGHRALVGGLLDSLQLLPPMGFTPSAGILDVLVGCLAAAFVLALKVAAPVLVALLLATVALGLLHRTVPQCNLLTMGIPVRVMLGLTAVAASLAAVTPLMEQAAGELGRSIQALALAAR
ncbi:MAG TPA: flagellar biosynthetic protein FliR [Phycisphaerae bacterium]|nr:flagellar biosynthetic protein FliR [Phycisphaerae bacterium]